MDETGLEVASCLHRVGQNALNMFRGELFGYPLFIMKNFMVTQNVKFCYVDVMCKLWKFVLQKEPEVAATVEPALSVMHAKSHANDCQVF